MAIDKNIYVDVIVPLPLNSLYTYSVPEQFQSSVTFGGRVIIQFGSKKLYTAIVVKIHSQRPLEYKTKPIVDLVDETPIISKIELELWRWIASYYLCAIGEVMKAALPAGLKLESETRIRLNSIDNYSQEILDNLSTIEIDIVDTLKGKKGVALKEINRYISVDSCHPYIKRLINRGVVSVDEKIGAKSPRVNLKAISLPPNLTTTEAQDAVLQELTRAHRQRQLFEEIIAVVNSIAKDRGCRVEEVEVNPNIVLSMKRYKREYLKALIEKRIVIESDSVHLDSSCSESSGKLHINSLSNYQQEAFDSIVSSFNSYNTTLLHGVTSSGKTEIYIKLIETLIESGDQALFLMPEIALTTQMIDRLKRSFGDSVDIYHSKVGDRDRVKLWNKIINYKKSSDSRGQIILGARSAIMLPFHSLKLIIVDEEHETSFKQYTPSPKYNARDCAIVLGNISGAKVLLGSATPAIETYYNAKIGKYGFVELTKRHGNVLMPKINLANSKEARRKKIIKRHFTPELYSKIEETLEIGKQAILFQNRRGYSFFLECDRCTWIPKCKNCDISLTHHKGDKRLCCHYCGYAEFTPRVCPSCGNEDIKNRGFGTEKIEDDLNELFPTAKIGRMDHDTTKGKDGYQKIINSLERGDIDILIGTQMVTKGLDFGNVNIVGVLDADTLLNYPDFRSYERSFQMLTQVSGRAGRRSDQGEVFIQSSNPNHPVLEHVVNNNYIEMYRSQIEEREQYNYPPFSRLILITVKHHSLTLLDRASDGLATILRKQFNLNILGPEYPLIKRISKLYSKQIWIKLDINRGLNSSKENIVKSSEFIISQKGYSKTTISIDVDPL